MARHLEGIRSVPLAVVMLWLWACGGSAPGEPGTVQDGGSAASGTTSTTMASTAPGQVEPGTIEGTAFSYNATGERRPIPNLRLWIRTGGDDAVDIGGAPLADITTDTNGHYRVTGLPLTDPFLVIEPAPGAEYRFICPTYPISLKSPLTWDLPLIHVTTELELVANGFWIPGTVVLGRVFEMVGTQRQPLAGATVTIEGHPSTFTNVHGFYALCSIGEPAFRISAAKPGYQNTERNFDREDAFFFDLELQRQ